MKKWVSFLAGVISMAACEAYALPANPWNSKPTDAPMYADTEHGSDILPVDPWAAARDRSGTSTWRGSGNHGRQNYTGEATTYTDAQGQEMIAPEVNRGNMIIMLEQLRRLGYKIPESYDQKIRDMPSAYGNLLRENYDKIGGLKDPLSSNFHRIMSNVEDGTGLDFDNLLFNSVDLLSTD